MTVAALVGVNVLLLLAWMIFDPLTLEKEDIPDSVCWKLIKETNITVTTRKSRDVGLKSGQRVKARSEPFD